MPSREERKRLKEAAADRVANAMLELSRVVKMLGFNKRLLETATDIDLRLYGLYKRLQGVKL